MSAPPPEAAQLIFSGIRACGISTIISLPDTVLHGVGRLASRDPEVRHIPCTREDEGLAIAAGLWLGGELAAVVTEGSGIGYSGLILARMMKQRTPTLVMMSHNRVFGERYDPLGATRIAGTGVLAGVGIPHALVTSRHELADRVAEAGVTARGQREPVALVITPSLMEK